MFQQLVVTCETSKWYQRLMYKISSTAVNEDNYYSIQKQRCLRDTVLDHTIFKQIVEQKKIFGPFLLQFFQKLPVTVQFQNFWVVAVNILLK
jgi:hypothetical protein